MRFFISFAVAALATDVEYTQEALKDEIKALPGIPAGLNFRHFSGYITVKGHWAEHALSASSLYRFLCAVCILLPSIWLPKLATVPKNPR